jgi:hypothetical protein
MKSRRFRTSADTATASFDPSESDFKSGKLPAGKCDFKAVPCVRFRKSLGTHVTLRREAKIGFEDEGLAAVNRLSQRTILVLNSASLNASLKELRIPESMNYHFGRRLETVIARAQQQLNPT